jgi:hypothetical protein
MPWLDRDAERRRLSLLLLERGEVSRRELQDAVGLSQPSLSRLLGGIEGLVRLGKGRHTRYALGRDALVKAAERAQRYPELAVGVEGAGRFRATVVAAGKAPRQVVVKFTAATPSPARRRWADLLVCEHLALETLRAHGHPAALTELLHAGGRVFLEVTRFERRTARPSIPPDAGQLAARTWYRAFIGCAATHAGHAPYFAGDALPLSAVPAHDLLPTLWAPAQGDLPRQALSLPELPQAERAVWEPMLVAARDFWGRVSADARISSAFRATAQESGAAVTSALAR